MLTCRGSQLGARILFGLACCCWLFAAPALSAPWEAPCFTWSLPDGWVHERTASGLWRAASGTEGGLQATATVARSSVSRELYLQGTAALWSSQGEVQLLSDWQGEPPGWTWFLVKHPPSEESPASLTLKGVVWHESWLGVLSIPLSESAWPAPRESVRKLARGFVLRTPTLSEASLRQEIRRRLDQDDQGWSSADAARREMNVVRQDWEPLFPSEEKPPLWLAYLEYMEARYEACFVADHGAELGMGADVLASRRSAWEERRRQLERRLAP